VGDVTPPPVRAAVSWSGGKDCCLALMRVGAHVDVRALITMFDETGDRSRSHGLRQEIIAAQADRLGLPLITGNASWPDYERVFVDLLERVAAAACTHVVFGDIFEDAHKAWTDRVTAQAGLVAVQPLWGGATSTLVREFLARQGQARITTIRSRYMDESWLGETLTQEAVSAFELMGIDPCGERGEYHTVVTSCPLFRTPMVLTSGESVERGDCWAIDFRLAETVAPHKSDHAQG
jgi:diphthine-ammonia ligase